MSTPQPWRAILRRRLGMRPVAERRIGISRLAPVPRPPHFSPMLLSRGTLPSGSAWVFEPKWDGFRALAYVSEDGVRLRSRRGERTSPASPRSSSAIRPRSRQP